MPLCVLITSTYCIGCLTGWWGARESRNVNIPSPNGKPSHLDTAITDSTPKKTISKPSKKVHRNTSNYSCQRRAKSAICWPNNHLSTSPVTLESDSSLAKMPVPFGGDSVSRFCCEPISLFSLCSLLSPPTSHFLPPLSVSSENPQIVIGRDSIKCYVTWAGEG